MRRVSVGLWGTVGSAVCQLILCLAIGRTPLYAGATCTATCGSVEPVTCSATGKDCSCEAQEGIGCGASCATGGSEPDVKDCEGPLPD
jgi:hypothetical protein